MRGNGFKTLQLRFVCHEGRPGSVEIDVLVLSCWIFGVGQIVIGGRVFGQVLMVQLLRDKGDSGAQSFTPCS